MSLIENDIVISGMSGRFPMSNNTDEFAKNLYDNIDMVSEDDSRWPKDLYGINNRFGKLHDFDKFDNSFFGLMQQLVDETDPVSKMLLETTYEAIIDSGINPQILRGSKTGVYIGISVYAMTGGYQESLQPDSSASKQRCMLQTLGNLQSLYANRISYVFDFKGPSMVVDTACSASLTAFNLAMNDLRLGHIDYAIIGGSHMVFVPSVLQMGQESGFNSKRGISAALDQSADGFVKSEAVCCVLLQKKSTAKRIYSSVLASRANIDGRKTTGMFFPSSEAQQELMIMSYKEANIDPLKLTYFEAHCTGTRAGDTPELKAIYNAYCALPKRKEKLPLGLLKSNTGHMEGASGISAAIKVMIAYECECIPANINLNKIKEDCEEYCPPLYPNKQNMQYEPGMAAVNNFGIGGANCHLLVEPNYKKSDDNYLKIAENMPRIVNICGRTEESVKYLFDFIEKNPNKISRDFLALLSDTMKQKPTINSAGFPFRGSVIIKKLSEEYNGIKYEYKKQMSVLNEKTIRPLWFLFPGLGGQWPAMARALMPIKIFADKVEECHEILSEFGIDLKYLLLSEDKQTMSTMTNKFCATTALQIALFDVMKALDITPDGIIGHSFGEIASAYADGCLTTRETLIVTYLRGLVTESDEQIPRGLMAVMALSKSDALELCPKGVYVVCNNAKDSVVVSGPFVEMKQMIDSLMKNGIFVRQLESSEIPYHSLYLLSSAQRLKNEINRYVPKPRLRSKKWVSTSVPDTDPEPMLKYASAEYFVNNLLKPVEFYERLLELPKHAIVVELSPHSIFGKIITDTIDTTSYISLLKKDSNDSNLDQFLVSIAKLYELGLNPAIENLYPKVEWPVARGTQSISSLMRWNHSTGAQPKPYPDYYCRTTACDMNVKIDINQIEDVFYSEHIVDSDVIYPAAGYILLVWRQLAEYHGRSWDQIGVVFENIQFKRAVFLSESIPSKIKVNYFKHTGDFVIFENSNVTCTGKINLLTGDTLLAQENVHEFQNRVLDNEICLERDDIYKELRIMGYDYGQEFRRLKQIRTNNFRHFFGTIEWNGSIVTFLDALLQSKLLMSPLRKLAIPVMIKKLRCDPKVLFAAIKRNKLVTENSLATNQLNDEIIEKFDISAERFCLYNSDIPFYLNNTTNNVITYGIEVENPIANVILRKSDSQDLKLDSYEFMANEDPMAIEESDKQLLLDYIEVCKSYASYIKQIGFKDMKCDFNYKKISDTKSQKYTADEYAMLKILNILATSIDKSTLSEFNLDKDIINQITNNCRLFRAQLDIVSENLVPKREIQILEINLSTDVMAKYVNNCIANYNLYRIDIEYKLIVKSKEYINEEYRDRCDEWNPKESNSLPNLSLTDLIVLKDTQELWELNVENFIQELNDAIIGNGFLITVFRYKFTEPENALNSLINSNKALNDSDLKKRINDFVTIAKNVGFNLICSKCDSIATMTLLFRKITEKAKIPESNQIIQINTKYEDWFDVLKEKLNLSKESNECKNIWLIGNESNINGILGLFNCLRLEPGKENIRCIVDLDDTIKHPIDFNSKPFLDILNNDLAVNVFKNGRLGTYRHLKLSKDYKKTVSNEYYLNVGQTRDLSGLQWFDGRSIALKSRYGYDLKNNKLTQIPCHIYSCGLAFRDVMVATGRITFGQLITSKDCLIGGEFVGRRMDTNERIMGFDCSQCIATSINGYSNMITNIPDHWSMEESVTVISTYSTVWYGLIIRAHLKQGESILIHSAAGGVGQAAINVCKHYNCDIYCTVGSEEKKQFLIKEYNIPENRIFSSRDILFKSRIMEMTEGLGVDLVLNSLAGNKLDASYACVANRGRFVELGKYDLLHNKQLGMYDFVRDIQFIGVAVDVCLLEGKWFGMEFFDWMHKNSTNGCVKPINRIVFKAQDAEQAFRYMTTGKHIGKIVIKIRDEEENRNALTVIKPANDMSVTTKKYFNPNKVYIITGGLGGFGLELVHWMLSLGGRKFVLTSRYGLRSDYQNFILKRLEAFGEFYKFFKSEIIVSTHDCTTIEGTKQLLTEAQQLGPIGGVFHSALVLSDCLLEYQTFEKFCESIDCKHKIFTNLDQLTRELDYSLDYFVIFSSITCSKGNMGQTNYGFGNSICERICEQRRSDGLHALAIQFGPIGDVGVLAQVEQTLIVSTLHKQRINSCCDVLNKLLAIHQPIVTSIIQSEIKKQTGIREKRTIKELWRALGINPENTPNYFTLGEIGMESMFAVKLQQELERKWNLNISLSHLKSITIQMLKEYEVGNVNNIKSYLDEMKVSSEKFLKYTFLLPNETHTKLNSIENGDRVYFMPPLEVDFSAFRELAKKIDRPVIGLNWTQEVNRITDFKDIVKYYLDLLNKISPNNSYDIVSCFDTALIALSMVNKANINNIIIVDILSDIGFRESKLSDEFLFEFICSYTTRELPSSLKDRLLREIKSEQNINAIITRLCSTIKEFVGTGLIATDLEEIITIMFKRAKIYSDIQCRAGENSCNGIEDNLAKYTGRISVIKPVDLNNNSGKLDESIKMTRQLYYLPKTEKTNPNIVYECVDENAFEITSEIVGNKIIDFLKQK